MSNRRDEIIKELEAEYGVECDGGFDPDALCDGDTCQSPECGCWTDFRNAVQDYLEEKLQTIRLKGSMSVMDVCIVLDDAPDYDAPVLIDGRAIDEMWWTGDGYHITTKELI